MFIDFLFDVFRQNAESEAVIWRDQSFAYGKLLNRTNQWRSYLRKNRIAAGTVTAVEADFSPNAIALMLALIETGCIAVPLTSSVAAKKAEFMAILESRHYSNLMRVMRRGLHLSSDPKRTKSCNGSVSAGILGWFYFPPARRGRARQRSTISLGCSPSSKSAGMPDAPSRSCFTTTSAALTRCSISSRMRDAL